MSKLKSLIGKKMFTLVAMFSTWNAAVALAGDITVLGECKSKVKPDRAAINLSVNQKAISAAEVNKKVNDIYNRVADAVKKLKLENFQIQTENISVYEDFEWQNGKQKLKGYQGSATLRVESSQLDRIGEAIPVALQAGANSFGGLSVFLSDETYNKAYRACLSNALEDAKLKAQSLLQSQGHKLGSLDSVVEAKAASGTQQPMAYTMLSARSEMADAKAAATEIHIKDQTIEVEVTAKYRF